jgi:4-hydroxy-tetrahydrodipicolinate synthase
MSVQSIRDLSGVGTALVTPFAEDLTVDVRALRRLVEFQIAGGVDFLVPGGTTGESATLTDDERIQVAEATLDVTAGRAPVIAGAGGNDTQGVIRLAWRYEELGVSGLLCVTPYYNKPTQLGLERHYQAIADATRLPIILYNVPSRTGVNLAPETTARLARLPNIVGIKEASGDVAQIAEIIALTPPEFRVFSGDDALILPVIALGGHGVVSVVSNEVPKAVVALTAAARAGRLDDARALSRRLLPLVKANFAETNPGPVKAALSVLGLIEENYRLPMVPVQPHVRERLAKLLGEFDASGTPGRIGK